MRMKNIYPIVVIIAAVVLVPSLFSFQPAELNAEEQLGKELFFDVILSQDYSISCASCHKPEFAFADNVAVSEGLFDQETARNTPTTMNLRAYESFAWDGRNKTLEQQSLAPLKDFAEMGMPVDEAVARLIGNEHYNASFRFVYSSIPSQETLGRALAAYQRTLFSLSAYDRYIAGAEDAISESAKRGLELFAGKAQCVNCHMGDDFTSGGFENIGTYNGKEYNDKGRGNYTKKAEDYGKFKVPSLRSVAMTAPYMHDGSIKTLREVIEYYNTPRKFRADAVGRGELIPDALHLTSDEVSDLEAFLISLSGEDIVKHK